LQETAITSAAAAFLGALQSAALLLAVLATAAIAAAAEGRVLQDSQMHISSIWSGLLALTRTAIR
jgi:hypothetical protein